MKPGGEPSIVLNSDSQVASSQPASRKKIDRKRGPRGSALLLKLFNYSRSRCSFPSNHSDHFLVNINRHESARRAEATRAGDELLLGT